MNRRPPRLTALGLAMVVFTACGGDGDGDGTASGPETSAAVTTTSPAGAPTSTAGDVVPTSPPPGDEEGCAPGVGSSPARFDPSGGLYATFLTGIDAAGRSVTFDVVQWLSGDAADEAYAKETGDDSGAPNDFFVVNASPEVRTAAIAPGARVRLVRLQEDGTATSDAGTVEELPSYLEGYRPSPPDGRLSYNPFWLRLEGGAVTSICEQYVP